MSEPNEDSRAVSTFKILCLDGGGAKGVYTLGFLKELEAVVKMPLGKYFDAIYGTSTGAIIAALLGLGRPAEEVLTLYLKHVPEILYVPYLLRWPYGGWFRSRALAKVGKELFKQDKFDAFQTFVGIVATNWAMERPLIFKSSVKAAYNLKETFLPGFGCTISEAVQASCSATPYFNSVELNLQNVGPTFCRDGGFAANNPALFALTDALKSFGHPAAQIRLLTLGVGHYPEPKQGLLAKILKRVPTAHLLQKTLNVNANTTAQLVKFLCNDVQHLRVSDRFESPELATDFLEYRVSKLQQLVVRGRQSFADEEQNIRNLFNLHATN